MSKAIPPPLGPSIKLLHAYAKLMYWVFNFSYYHSSYSSLLEAFTVWFGFDHMSQLNQPCWFFLTCQPNRTDLNMGLLLVMCLFHC